MTVEGPPAPPLARSRRDAAGGLGETGFEDVYYDLISVQYHSLQAGHDDGQYVRDAENAGLDDVASFFRQVMEEDSTRAERRHELLGRLQGTEQAGPAAQ